MNNMKFLKDFAGLNLSEIDEVAEQTLRENYLDTYYEVIRPGLVLKYTEKLNQLIFGQVDREEKSYAEDDFIPV